MMNANWALSVAEFARIRSSAGRPNSGEFGYSKLACAALAVMLAAGGCARDQQPPVRVKVSNVNALRTAFGSAADTAAAPVALAEPTGWATITGKFTIDGAAPPRDPLTIDKDISVCAPGGKQVLSETVVVDSATGGIKDIVIYLVTPAKFPVGDPKWEHPVYAAAGGTMPEFDQKDCIFLSHMFVMRSNQQLKVLNSDPVGHNTKIEGGGKAAPSNDSIPASGYSLYTPGGQSTDPMSVACSIHPWMSANLLVRDSPYFTVTKADGSFEIKNVPAGVELEFKVWQERAKAISGVTVNGKQEPWPKGRMKIKLQPDQPLTLDVKVPAAAFSK